jgi:peptide chain release factor 1
MGELVQAELAGLQTELEHHEAAMRAELLKPDADDGSSAILEVRAGTGGDEAALFTAELFAMYERYADLCNWDFDIITKSEDGPSALRVLLRRGTRDCTDLAVGRSCKDRGAGCVR